MGLIMNAINRRSALHALEEAKAALGSLTPLKINCGKICGGACCEPDESGENGMLLFPFEEELYKEPIEGFPFRLIDDDTLFKGGKRFVCEGKCSREHRPLACRLFPLRIRLECDQTGDETRAMSQDFIKAVEQAGEALAQDASMLEALHNEQRLLDEMRRL